MCINALEGGTNMKFRKFMKKLSANAKKRANESVNIVVEKPQVIKTCPKCHCEAHTETEALSMFGKRGKYWQSYCKKCR